jgi:hypothetical protein
MVSGYMESEIMNACLDTDERPDSGDKTRWNQRLLWQQPYREISDYSGHNLPVANYVANGLYIKPRPQPLIEGTVRAQEGLCANTFCLPLSDENGTRIFVYVRAAQATRMVQAEERLVRLSFAAWLMQSVRAQPAVSNVKSRPNKWDRLARKGFQEAETAVASLDKVTESPKPEVIEQVVDAEIEPATSSTA